MYIRSTLFATIAAVFAFAVPAVASAEITNSEGEPIPVGETIEGTSTNSVLETEAFGALECEEITVFDEVTENTSSSSEAQAGAEGETVGC